LDCIQKASTLMREPGMLQSDVYMLEIKSFNHDPYIWAILTLVKVSGK